MAAPPMAPVIEVSASAAAFVTPVSVPDFKVAFKESDNFPPLMTQSAPMYMPKSKVHSLPMPKFT